MVGSCHWQLLAVRSVAAFRRLMEGAVQERLSTPARRRLHLLSLGAAPLSGSASTTSTTQPSIPIRSNSLSACNSSLRKTGSCLQTEFTTSDSDSSLGGFCAARLAPRHSLRALTASIHAQ